jgi:hypothetical protein
MRIGTQKPKALLLRLLYKMVAAEDNNDQMILIISILRTSAEP